VYPTSSKVSFRSSIQLLFVVGALIPTLLQSLLKGLVPFIVLAFALDSRCGSTLGSNG
jgi:hypothetical protein